MCANHGLKHDQYLTNHCLQTNLTTITMCYPVRKKIMRNLTITSQKLKLKLVLYSYSNSRHVVNFKFCTRKKSYFGVYVKEAYK